MIEGRTSNYWVKNLQLAPHPEGGFFREVHRSTELIPHSALAPHFSGARTFATSIYYLLESRDFSAFHRILSDETWHFYAGGPLEVVMLVSDTFTVVTLGSDLERGQHLQFTVPKGTWFASRPCLETHYSLLGCTVSPGFDFADFELGDRNTLLREFPRAREVIHALTRDT
jgi:predicted cupin superfamily sugar epimerase